VLSSQNLQSRCCGICLARNVEIATGCKAPSLFGKNPKFDPDLIRSHLKNRILGQGQGGADFQPAGIHKYVEELKRGANTEIGPKDIFEIASGVYPQL
jgi:hypothetical protein